MLVLSAYTNIVLMLHMLYKYEDVFGKSDTFTYVVNHMEELRTGSSAFVCIYIYIYVYTKAILLRYTKNSNTEKNYYNIN